MQFKFVLLPVIKLIAIRGKTMKFKLNRKRLLTMLTVMISMGFGSIVQADLITSAAEMPSFESQLTENPSPQNPLGFKGIAESGTIGGVPAVQNAVVDALSHLGIRHLDLPVTPKRVWQAITTAS